MYGPFSFVFIFPEPQEKRLPFFYGEKGGDEVIPNVFPYPFFPCSCRWPRTRTGFFSSLLPGEGTQRTTSPFFFFFPLPGAGGPTEAAGSRRSSFFFFFFFPGQAGGQKKRYGTTLFFFLFFCCLFFRDVVPTRVWRLHWPCFSFFPVPPAPETAPPLSSFATPLFFFPPANGKCATEKWDISLFFFFAAWMEE